MELEPSLLIVVVLDRFRSKLQDFCDVCRRHITAPLPCASFDCSLTRCTTAEFQHNDIMMKTTVQNDLRLEMALESMWIVCAHEKPNNYETTENKRACATNCTLTSTSLSQHESRSTGLFHTSSCRKTLRFPQSRGSGCCSTQSRICSPLLSLPQSVKLKYQRYSAVLHVSQYIPRIQSTAAEASSCACFSTTLYLSWIHSMKSSMDSHKSDSHCIERKIERRITCLLQRVIKQSDSFCLLLSTCCVCVYSSDSP